MKSLVGPTGGRVVLADEFQSDAFRESLARLMELGLPVVLESDEGIPEEVPGVVHQGHNATIEVFCQPGVRVAGALGPCASLGRAGRVVAETPLGMGGTSAWVSGRAMGMCITGSVSGGRHRSLPPCARRRWARWT